MQGAFTELPRNAAGPRLRWEGYPIRQGPKDHGLREVDGKGTPYIVYISLVRLV